MNIPNTSGTPDYGLVFQGIGFGLVAFISLAILEAFAGSDFWLYQAFETAVTKLYWAFAILLIAIFEWGRRMFLEAKAIIQAKKDQIHQRGLEEGRKEGRKEMEERFRALLEKHDVSLPDEMVDEMFDKR